MRAKKGKAQSFIEYAVLIGIIVGVIIAMRVYMVRAVQGRYRESADVFGGGEQYAKGLTQVNESYPGIGTPPEPPPPPPITCSQVLANVERLESEINTLSDQVASMRASADQTEASIPALQAQVDALTVEAAQNDAWARNERDTAAALTAEADEKQEEIDNYKEDFPFCFTGGCLTSCGDGDNCCCILERVAELEVEILSLRRQADEHITRAEGYEARAQELRDQAASLSDSILKLEEQISNLRAEADELETGDGGIEEKQTEIDRYRDEYPDCF